MEDVNVQNLPPGYTYLFGSDKNMIRIKEVTDQSSAEAWLKDYEEFTKTTWRKAATYPNSGKINIFRVDLRCVHLTDKRVKGVRSSKNTNCPAKLNIIVKRYTAGSRAKVIDNLVPEWPTIVTFKDSHNHSIISAAALKYRDMSDETREKLRSLFRQGHNSSSALHCLKTDLLLENNDNYYQLAADTHYVPTMSVVHKLFEKEFAHDYGCFSGDVMFENLTNKLEDYSKTSNGGTARTSKTKDGMHYFVVLCTPIMSRTHENITQCRELVMVDASGGMDKQRHRVYFFITPTAAGGLPLGVIITDSEKEYVFDEALQELQNILPNGSFYKQGHPTVFLTDNDLKERNPLRRNFPGSTLLLCQFHFLKACWRWLCDHKHNISKDHRQELYFSVKHIVYAPSVEEASRNCDLLLSSVVSRKYPSFGKYFADLWKCKEDWATCYRQKYMLRGSNTTNYVEIVFRILKDCILDRIMAFNLIQLVDYILTRYEMYMEKRLIDFTNGRYPKTMLKRMLPFENDQRVPHKVEEMSNVAGSFKITSGKSNSEYCVDLVSGTCTCVRGETGVLCSHASAVVLYLENQVESGFNLVNDRTKEVMYLIATGRNCPINWLKPLTESIKKNCPESSYIERNNSDSPHVSTEEQSHASTALDEASFGRDLIDEAESSQSITSQLTEKEQESFTNLLGRIDEGIRNQPSIFVPAVRKMLINVDRFASTETGLISALHTFGKYGGLLPVGQKKKSQPRRKHSSLIGVQPTAIGRRKLCLSGKRKLSAGRPRQDVKINPNLQDHGYTPFNSLPAQKKTPHNLQTAVYLNKSVGAKKCRKT